MGRKTLYAHEMRRMIHAENLADAYKKRLQGNAAEWASKNPELNKLLGEAKRLVDG